MTAPFAAPSVVVGIDGSPAAARAAVWAVDEAVSRDIPLRLVAVGEPTADSGHADLQAAVRAAAAAVRSAGRPVVLETAVVTGAPTLTLLEASRTAAMLCVGAVGLRHLQHQRIGSTAAALAASAHCPLAVIRGDAPGKPGWVVVELDDTAESAAVLQTAVEEARLRSAPLRVLGTRMVRARLDRRLSQWRDRYPDLDVQPVPARAAPDYLTEHAGDIALLVLSARNAGPQTLHDTACSVLIVDRQRVL